MATERRGKSSGRKLREIHKQYSPEEDQKLRELYDARLGVEKIGLAIGRPFNSIRARLRRLKLNNRKTRGYWTAEEEALLCQGIVPEGRNHAGIRKKCKRLGVPLPYSTAKTLKETELNDLVVEMRRQGSTIKEISERVHWNRDTVSKRLQRLGLEAGWARRGPTPKAVEDRTPRKQYEYRKKEQTFSPNTLSREEELALINAHPVRRMPSALSEEFKSVPLMTFDRKAKRYGRPELALS